MIRYSLGRWRRLPTRKPYFVTCSNFSALFFPHFFFWAGHGTLEIRAVMLWKHCMETENYSFSSLKCTGSGQVECLQIYKVLNFIHARPNRRQSEKKKLEDSFLLHSKLSKSEPLARETQQAKKKKSQLFWIHFGFKLNFNLFHDRTKNFLSIFFSIGWRRSTYTKKNIVYIRREVDISAELNKSSEAHSQNTAKKKKCWAER